MDSVLDSLDKICTQTISISARIKSGDNSAIAELGKLTNEYQNLSNSMSGATEITPAQRDRYFKILTRYAQAMR